MYATRNFPTKKALKEAVAAYHAGTGPAVTYFQPGPFGGAAREDGPLSLEGPHYPRPHTWYASCVAKSGAIIKVK